MKSLLSISLLWFKGLLNEVNMVACNDRIELDGGTLLFIKLFCIFMHMLEIPPNKRKECQKVYCELREKSGINKSLAHE